MLHGWLIVLAPVLIVYLAFRVRAGMRAFDATIWAVLGVYGLWAADLLFFPLYADAGLRATDPYLAEGLRHWINLVPFATITRQARVASESTIRQLWGNVGLLLPIGLLGPLVAKPLRSLGRLALIAGAISAAIEAVQLIGTLSHLMRRSVDVDDVILNVAGAVLGWLLWRMVSSVARRMTMASGQHRAEEYGKTVTSGGQFSGLDGPMIGAAASIFVDAIAERESGVTPPPPPISVRTLAIFFAVMFAVGVIGLLLAGRFVPGLGGPLVRF